MAVFYELRSSGHASRRSHKCKQRNTTRSAGGSRFHVQQEVELKLKTRYARATEMSQKAEV